MIKLFDDLEFDVCYYLSPNLHGLISPQGFDRIYKLAEENKKLKDTMKTASELLNNIKYELSSHVYTLVDDEFEDVFYARDLLDEALKK